MKFAPLSSAFLATSMIGFLVSALYVSSIDKTWAFTFGVVFSLMFTASMISMVNADPEEQLGVRKFK